MESVFLLSSNAQAVGHVFENGMRQNSKQPALVGDLPRDKPEGVGLLDGVRSIFARCPLR